MFSIEDFAKMSKVQQHDALKEMGVSVPTGNWNGIELCNFMLKKQGLGVLSCKIPKVSLADALEHGLLLLDGKPYPERAQDAAPAPAAAEDTVPHAVKTAAPAATASDKIAGDAEEATTIRRLIMAGATKAIRFDSAQNQREKVPLTVRGRRITYTIGHTLPILDAYLEVVEQTTFNKPRYTLEDGKPKKKVEKVRRFHYQVSDILRTEELRDYWPLVEQTQARLKAEREAKAKAKAA